MQCWCWLLVRIERRVRQCWVGLPVNMGIPVHSDHCCLYFWTGTCISWLAEAAITMVTALLAVLVVVRCCVDARCGVCTYPWCMLVRQTWVWLISTTSTCWQCCLWSAYFIYSIHHAKCMSPMRQARQACQKLTSLSKWVDDNTVYWFDISAIFKLFIWNYLTSKSLK